MTTFRWEYHDKAARAGAILNKAVKDGELERPTVCELCGQTPKPTPVTRSNGNHFERPSVVGHHWQGYDKPLEVLWICQRCNIKLTGPQFHNGTVTKDESKEYVLSFTRKGPKQSWSKRCGSEGCGSYASVGRDFCYHHDPEYSKSFCKGVTLKGEPCRHKVIFRDWYCGFHRQQGYQS